MRSIPKRQETISSTQQQKTTTKNQHAKSASFLKKIAEICPSPSFFSASSFSAFSFCPGTGWPQTVEIDRRFFLHHGQPGSDYLALKIHYYSNYSTCKNTPSHPPPRKKEKKTFKCLIYVCFFSKIHVISPCLTSVTLRRIPWVASEATKRLGDEIHRAPIWSRADLGFPHFCPCSLRHSWMPMFENIL